MAAAARSLTGRHCRYPCLEEAKTSPCCCRCLVQAQSAGRKVLSQQTGPVVRDTADRGAEIIKQIMIFTMTPSITAGQLAPGPWRMGDDATWRNERGMSRRHPSFASWPCTSLGPVRGLLTLHSSSHGRRKVCLWSTKPASQRSRVFQLPFAPERRDCDVTLVEQLITTRMKYIAII